MTSTEYLEKLQAKIKKIPYLRLKTYPLKYKAGNYDFIKVRHAQINTTDRILLIRAGIHGDEISGPLAILDHIEEIVNQANLKDIKLIIYPLGNPSGFEKGKRYNIDNDSGEGGNNDFLRYELEDGRISGDIGESNEFKAWFWSSDPKFGIHLPAETVLMHSLLKEDPINQVGACIDLHQDYLTPNAHASAYHYVCENPQTYAHIAKKIEKVIPLLKNVSIGAGYEEGAMTTDENGFIVRHDGSFSDLTYRMGVKHSIAAETMGITPRDKAIRTNMIWIEEIINGPYCHHE